MENNALLAPAAALVLWSLIVLGWLVATRFPAFSKAGINAGDRATRQPLCRCRKRHAGESELGLS